MERKGVLDMVFDIYKKNLEMLVPIVLYAIFLYLAVLFAVILFLPMSFIWLPWLETKLFWDPTFLLKLAILIILVLIPIAAVGGAIAFGTLSRMALSAVTTGKSNLERDFKAAMGRLAPLIIVLLLTAVLSIIASVVPILGPALVITALSPAPILVILGSSASNAISDAFRIMSDAFNRKAEIPLVIFIIALLSSTGTIGLLVLILGVPYAYLLLAYYIVYELKWAPPPPRAPRSPRRY